MYETLQTELKDGILTLRLHRPENLNAYTEKMSEELAHFYEEVNYNDDVRVIVVTGSGKAFCAGMDLTNGHEVFASKEAMEDFRDIGGQVSLKVFELKKPIIAAINGPAVGIGLTMTLPMDIRILKRDTKIGFVFGKVGIGPEAASGWFLPRLVGMGAALEWMVSGRYIATDEALTSGLVQYVVEDPLEKAYEIAQSIIKNTAATSNYFTRQLLWKMNLHANPYDSHVIESKFLHWASRNADVEEGISSFLEKREAKFPLKTSDVPDFFNS